MTRKEYIQVLKDGLYGFDEATKADIVLEMEDHLDELVRQQVNLTEEEIIAGLEAPDSLAASLRAEAGIGSEQAQASSGAGEAAGHGGAAGTADAAGPQAEWRGEFRGERTTGGAGRAGQDRDKAHSAHITIDGEDLDDLVDRLRDMARIFRQQKSGRQESAFARDAGGPAADTGGFKATFEFSDDDEGAEADEDEDIFIKEYSDNSIKRLTLRCRQSDVNIFLSLSGLSIRASGDNACRMRLSQSDPESLEVQTDRAREEPDEIELRVPATVEMVTIVTVSGDIYVADRIGNLALRSTSGDILLKQCSGNTSISSISGDVEAASCSETLDIQTTSGEISVTADPQCDGVRMASVSGDIDFRYPEDFNATLSWSTVSGDIEHDGAAFAGARVIRLGSGGAPVRLSTVSGDITIRAGGR